MFDLPLFKPLRKKAWMSLIISSFRFWSIFKDYKKIPSSWYNHIIMNLWEIKNQIGKRILLTEEKERYRTCSKEMLRHWRLPHQASRCEVDGDEIEGGKEKREANDGLLHRPIKGCKIKCERYGWLTGYLLARHQRGQRKQCSLKIKKIKKIPRTEVRNPLKW